MSKKDIEDCIRDSLEQYFKDLRGTEPHAVHAMVVGKTVDDAMVAIERDNPRLKGVLPKDYARPRPGQAAPGRADRRHRHHRTHRRQRGRKDPPQRGSAGPRV